MAVISYSSTICRKTIKMPNGVNYKLFTHAFNVSSSFDKNNYLLCHMAWCVKRRAETHHAPCSMRYALIANIFLPTHYTS
jgi:hypothetical protein